MRCDSIFPDFFVILVEKNYFRGQTKEIRGLTKDFRGQRRKLEGKKNYFRGQKKDLRGHLKVFLILNRLCIRQTIVAKKF